MNSLLLLPLLFTFLATLQVRYSIPQPHCLSIFIMFYIFYVKGNPICILRIGLGKLDFFIFIFSFEPYVPFVLVAEPNYERHYNHNGYKAFRNIYIYIYIFYTVLCLREIVVLETEMSTDMD